MTSDLAPSLLVAMDQVLDPNFRRSVVFVMAHGEAGALGLVVNRKAHSSMADLCRNHELVWRGDPGLLVDWGGPVSPEQGWVLLGDPAIEAPDLEEVTDEIRCSRSPDVLRQVAESPSTAARVFLGYAGWGAGQLEAELAEGSWLVVPASSELLFHTPYERMWELAVRSLGIEPATLVSAGGVN